MEAIPINGYADYADMEQRLIICTDKNCMEYLKSHIDPGDAVWEYQDGIFRGRDQAGNAYNYNPHQGFGLVAVKTPQGWWGFEFSSAPGALKDAITRKNCRARPWPEGNGPEKREIAFYGGYNR